MGLGPIILHIYQRLTLIDGSWSHKCRLHGRFGCTHMKGLIFAVFPFICGHSIAITSDAPLCQSMPLPASNASLRGSPSTPNNPLYQPCISNGPLYEPSVSNNPLCGPASAAPQTATIGSVEYVIFGSGYESSFVNASAYCASLNESYPWNQGCQKSVQGLTHLETHHRFPCRRQQYDLFRAFFDD